MISEPFFTHPDEMKKEQEYKKDNPPIFVCKADGIPKPDVKWFKNDEPHQHKSGEITSHNFVLKVKSPDATGPIRYSCLVWNKFGNISYEFILTLPNGRKIYQTHCRNVQLLCMYNFDFHFNT